MKVQEFIKLVNDGKYPCMYEMEENVGSNAVLVDTGLDRKFYSGYVNAINVYQCDDGYVGALGPIEKFDEFANWEDLFEACFAEEYVAQRSVTYRPKDNN